MKICNSSRGFTIPELLVTMTILAILSTIGFISYVYQVSKARDTARSSDIKNISKIIKLYQLDTGKVPSPTNSVDVTFSGATVWSQGTFGKDSANETQKIFGELRDPKFQNEYSYSTTQNKKEYQLSAVFENQDVAANLIAAIPQGAFSSQVYADSPFSPLELSPKIWLDATDIDGDGNIGNNPSNGDTITEWRNKSSAGNLNNPTITTGNLRYSANAMKRGDDSDTSGYPAVFIANNAGLRLENSDISQGDIFYVVQKKDPFGGTDYRGYGLYSSTNDRYNIGHYSRYAGVLSIGDSPNINKRMSWKGKYVFGFHVENNNYSFRNSGRQLAVGATNPISGTTWAFNRAGAQPTKGSDLLIGEVLIFDTPLSVSERQKVEGYLAHKWGRRYDLPWNHPYYSTPPVSSGPPPAPDTQPDAFQFNNITGAQLSQEYISNPITVSGINTASPISVSGGKYRINNGEFTQDSGLVSQGDTVELQLLSAASDTTSSSASLTIGGVSSTFQLTTFVADVTPDAFSFSPISGANMGKDYTSNTVYISGVNTNVPISITGTGAEYKISDGQDVDVSEGVNIGANYSALGRSPSKMTDNDISGFSTWGNQGSLPVEIRIDLGAGKKETITKYTLYRKYDGWYWENASPRTWTFEGSNDGTSWDTLDSQTNEAIYFNSKRSFSFQNNISYRYYRFNITASNSFYGYLSLTEIELLVEGAGEFTNTPGNIGAGEYVSVRMPASAKPGTSKTANLRVGSTTSPFSITTVGADTTPELFGFPSITNADLNRVYESLAIEVSGINTSTPISISGSATYSINEGSYTSSPGTIQNGDRIKLRQSSPSVNSASTISTLTIGGVSANFEISTPAPPPDTTPDPFSFSSVVNANLNQLYTSDSVTIRGINTGAPLRITDGEYSLNGANFSSANTTVQNGDVIRLRGQSKTAPEQSREVIVSIGGVEGRFAIETLRSDTNFEDFSFSNISGADIATSYTSDPVQIEGINVPITLSISGGEYSINGGNWSSVDTNLVNNDSLQVRAMAASTWGNTSAATVTIGGTPKQFSITTGIGDTTPDQFIFNDDTGVLANTLYSSNSITVSGINTTTNISVVGGEYQIGDTPYTNLAGSVQNGDVVKVRLVSSIEYGTSKSVTLNIGGVTDSYDLVTQNGVDTALESPSLPQSDVYVTGNYNGLLLHTSTGSSHYILAAPSIIASDLSNPDYEHIISEKKLVYRGFNNTPASYDYKDRTSTGGFDFTINNPVFFQGEKEDIGSYSGLKAIDEGVRRVYADFPAYSYIAKLLDDYSLGYLEKIIGASIGINPIKPYYCSDILRSKLIYNIAKTAKVQATKSLTAGGIKAITNGVKDTQGNLDVEYQSETGNAFISFEWEKLQKIGYIRIYNRTQCCTSDLTGASIKLYNKNGSIIYSHSLWDTTEDYIVELDLEGIGQLHYVKKMTIESVGGRPLALREVEIFEGGDISSGTYKVDKDGLGGQQSYNVYCDMITDGGGWTRIGENYIDNGNFASQNHASQHTFTGYDAVSDNLIVDHTTKNPPASLPGAYALKHSGTSSESYRLFFDKVPGEYFAQEIRLSAWVSGTNSSVFAYTLNYDAGNTVSKIPEFDVLEQDGSWTKVMVRIPLDGLVKDFTWDIGKGISAPFYITGLNMEVFYK